MWRGYEQALLEYSRAICQEWADRGYLEQTFVKIQELFYNEAPFIRQQNQIEMPPWLGDPELHLAYQSKLIRKDPEFYTQQYPGVPDDIPFVWPISA